MNSAKSHLNSTRIYPLLRVTEEGYIPSAAKPNLVPELGKTLPNQFWYAGAVTVSRIHRAKGNEADLLYGVGFDQVAQDEGNIRLRNQLFVALTRARG